jgi:superfamily I DNA and/or RNA helicase
MKTGKIFDIVSSVESIKKKRLPIRLSFALNANLKKFESAIEVFNDERYKLFEQYGKKDQNGKIIVDEAGNVSLEDPVAFSKDVRDLRDVDVDIAIQKVSIDILDACDTDKFDSLTPAELELIDFMIE